MVNRSEFLDHYVQELIRRGAIRSALVQSAFQRVERDRFISYIYQYTPQSGRWELLSAHNPQEPDTQILHLIYSDRAIVTAVQDNLPLSSTTQPSLVAQMVELLELGPGARVLEIGTGTGYNAALLAEIVRDQGIVVSVDIHEQLVTQSAHILKQLGYGNVHVLCRDGFYGASEYAPYDRIIVTTGCADMSPHWFEQVSHSGFVLVPLQHGGPSCHPLVKVEHGIEQSLLGQVVSWAGFTPAQGKLAWADEAESPWITRLPTYVLQEDPVQVYPPLPALQNLPLTEDTHTSFYFFLALYDQGTCKTHQGYGLISTESAAIITERGVFAYSKTKNTAATHNLYSKLLTLYRKWHELGLPRWQEYQLQFIPMGAGSSLGRLSQQGNWWSISRKWFQQVLKLRRQGDIHRAVQAQL